MDNLKQCNCCDKWKFKTDFGKYSKSKDGLKGQCKKCKNKKAREFYQERKKLNTDKKLKSIAEKEVKQCSCCKHWKFLADFKIDRKTKIGYGSYCKSCHNKKHLAYHNKNKEERLEYIRLKRLENIDKERQRSRNYYQNNKEKEYWRTLKKRTLRNAKEVINNITDISNKRIKYQLEATEKYLYLFENDSEKYTIVRKANSMLFIEAERRFLDVKY